MSVLACPVFTISNIIAVFSFTDLLRSFYSRVVSIIRLHLIDSYLSNQMSLLASLSFRPDIASYKHGGKVVMLACCNCRSWVSLYRRSNASPYILIIKPRKYKERECINKFFANALVLKMKMKFFYRVFGASCVPLIRRRQISSSDDSAHHSCSLTWVIVRRRSTSRFSIAWMRLIEGSDIIQGIRNSWSRISSML